MEQPIRILIVEDNVIIAHDMQSMLEEIGYEIVDNVIVYEQAVEVLKNKEVDLVLIDIILASDKTGIDLGKHIRQNGGVCMTNMGLIIDVINRCGDVKR